MFQWMCSLVTERGSNSLSNYNPTLIMLSDQTTYILLIYTTYSDQKYFIRRHVGANVLPEEVFTNMSNTSVAGSITGLGENSQ